MKIALNTDYLQGTGSPEKYLRFMAEAGFTHVHWCHQWCTDFLYSTPEINEYKKILKRYGLTLLDIHGTGGQKAQEKCWYSTDEYRRKAGVELTINRMIMLREMEGEGVLMMHPPYYREGAAEEERKEVQPRIEAMMRTLDDLIPFMEKYNVKIALENMPADTFEVLPSYLKEFPAEWIGVTFDSGHANMLSRQGIFKHIWHLKERIEALHLHDNDSSGDQHQPPFYGNIDWTEVARLLKESSYSNTGRPLSFELSMRNTPFYNTDLAEKQTDESLKAYLADAYTRCKKVVEMYEAL